MTSQIIALGFEGQLSAEALLKDLLGMHEDGLIELEDVVIASRGTGTHVEFKQLESKTGAFAARGGGVGLLAGLLLGGPIVGLVGGAAIGAVAAKLKDYGVDDKFIREIGDNLGPKTSALVLMVKASDPEKALERMRPLKANVLSTTLPADGEKRLREALAREDFT